MLVKIVKEETCLLDERSKAIEKRFFKKNKVNKRINRKANNKASLNIWGVLWARAWSLLRLMLANSEMPTDTNNSYKHINFSC